ncbi:MAG: DUF1343 domain-containing protein [Ignavibacterium sp.]|nr:DUF1343 domain-containing protein [Ignavibacterium sp.]
MKKSFYLFAVLTGLIIFGCASSSTLIINVAELKYPSDLNVTSRSEWGWQPLVQALPAHSITKITIHHSGEVFDENYSVQQYLKNLQNWSRTDKKWIDIPYHFMIDLKGNIYEARPINFPGDTNTDYDVRGHALICVIGNYEEQKIIQNQLHSLVKLTAFLKSKYNVPIKDIKGHKDYTPTLCPGEDLYKYLQDGSFITMVEDELNKSYTLTTAKVKPGIEALRDRNFDLLKGKKVGLVTNATGVDSELKSTIDILFEAHEVNLVALYGPEHGVRGNFEAGEYVDFYIDDFTQLPVYSLYGKTRKPSPEMLKDIDVLVFDIQDIGSRSYTYISTMGLVMEAAAENNKEVIILDRPNPLGGNRIEGNLVEDGYFSFVSQFAIPYVHGLTVGELAMLLNEEGLLSKARKCKIQVVAMEHWTRDMFFERTGLPWILTSPHVPHYYSAFYYTASGIIGELRGVISIGVGYTIPFQTFAAEWINSQAMTNKMNSYNLPGVNFRPITYKPFYGFGKGKMLHGVQIYITNYSTVNLMEIQFYFLQAVNELYPGRNLIIEGKNDDMFDKVLGTSKIREMFIKNQRVEDIRAYLNKDVESFRKLSKKYYLYH